MKLTTFSKWSVELKIYLISFIKTHSASRYGHLQKNKIFQFHNREIVP